MPAGSGSVVWLASYPKSGNTWVRVFVANLLAEADGPVDINRLGRVPNGAGRRLFDLHACVDSSDLTEPEVDDLRPLVFQALAAEGAAPVLLKVHDRFRRLGSGRPLFPAEITGGVIYVVRNPLDVACSYAFHRGADVDAVIAMMADPEHGLGRRTGGLDPNHLVQRVGTWSDHVESWVDSCDFPRCLVRYEDLHLAPLATFRSISEFLGAAVGDDRLELCIRWSGFHELRSQEERAPFREGSLDAPRFFRRGVVGAWRDELDEGQVRRIVDDHGDVMTRLGYLDSRGRPAH